jgi:hypothetical protein
MDGVESRLGIYRNNMLLGLSAILAEMYPVIQKITGAHFFNFMAHEYIKSHPQLFGNRHMFGKDLSAFLRDFQPAKQIPYTADVAALEWAYFQAGIADDANRLDFETLAFLSSTQENFRLFFHPSVQILHFGFNALEIWQEHQHETVNALILRESDNTLLIWRDLDDDINFKSVSDATLDFLNTSTQGEGFAAALFNASQVNANQVNAGQNHVDMEALQKEFGILVSAGFFASSAY